jgi:hypothetical protein
MGASSHGGLFGVQDWNDWEGGSATWSELVGGGAGPDIIGPSQTYDAPGAQSQMTCSRQHLLRLVLTVLRMHSRTRRTRYVDGLGLGGEDEESARSGTGRVDTPDSVHFLHLNCFWMILFYF